MLLYEIINQDLQHISSVVRNKAVMIFGRDGLRREGQDVRLSRSGTELWIPVFADVENLEDKAGMLVRHLNKVGLPVVGYEVANWPAYQEREMVLIHIPLQVQIGATQA